MAIITTRVEADDNGEVLFTLPANGDADVAEVVVNNKGANPVSLGATGVTFTDGYELSVGASERVTLYKGDSLVGITGNLLATRVDVMVVTRNY